MTRLSLFVILLVLCSVTSLAQAEITPTVAKRIADHTPKPLPQTDTPIKQESDLSDMNVRGRVKNIVEEREYFAETDTSKGRYFSSIVDFNERGDRIKAVYFDERGNPYDVSAYGYIDGARVMSSTTIYEGTRIFTGGGSPGEQPKAETTPDPRFRYKYVYQYVSGKLSSKEILHNDGSKWMRYQYNRSGNQVEELIYSSNGKLNQKYITILDPKGNEVERRDIAVINLPREDRVYRIVTDSKDQMGNWTKRTFFKVSTENGMDRATRWKVEYRKLTYFDRASKAIKSKS
jgi:hypothetical protein